MIDGLYSAWASSEIGPELDAGLLGVSSARPDGNSPEAAVAAAAVAKGGASDGNGVAVSDALGGDGDVSESWRYVRVP